MKKILVLLAVGFLCLGGSPPQVDEEAVVINIEVPVRVFDDGVFVDDLTIDDFQVFEDGKAQTIEAVYLVKKRTVERSEEKRRFLPSTNRHFFLFFEISEYSAKVGEAIDAFYQNVLYPGDNLIIVTPLRAYKLREEVLKSQPKEKLSAELKELLRRDALMGNAEYRGAIKELIGLAKTLTAGEGAETGSQSQQLDEFTQDIYGHLPLEKQLMRYINIVNRVSKLRRIDQDKLLSFADMLENQEGQKVVFIVYQREYIPQLEPRVMQKYINLYQDKPHILRALYGLFDVSRRQISFDVDRVKEAYADASISIHFLFVTPPIPHLHGVYFQERSEDVFGAFREMARATGGFVDASANPAASIEKAVHASENYYLLYYSPPDYKRDGRFRNIRVRVRKGGYQVVHRLGYFAD